MMAPIAPDVMVSAARVLAAPRRPYHLTHHPGAWEVLTVKGEVEGVKLDGPVWLPILSTLASSTPGANLIRTRQAHEPVEAAYQHARHVDRDRGVVWLEPTDTIPASCLPAGVPVGGYIRAIQCVDPAARAEGVLHVEAWQVPAQTVPGQPQRFVVDMPKYNMWRAWLVIKGRVEPPMDYIREALVAEQEQRLERIVSRPTKSDAPAEEQRKVCANYRAAIIPGAKAESSK
jgi:hypothetical protein